MRKRLRGLCVLFLCATLFLMQSFIAEADGNTSASDFQMEGTELTKYKGTSKDVSIPTGVESIGRSAFEDNDTITHITMPKTVKLIGSYAFWDCDKLKKVSLGSGLREVGDYVFANCSGLTEITIPDNIRSIGIQAFANCTDLRVIKIPPEVTFIHETAFDGCINLVIDCEEGSYADKYAEDFYERQAQMPDYSQDRKDEESDEENKNNGITVPVTNGELLGASSVVGNHAFVIIDPEGQNVLDGDLIQQNILDNASMNFNGQMLQRFSKYTIVDQVVVADQAYYGSDKLGFVELPVTIREIGQFAFARSSLRKITLPEGLETICYGAFYGCDKLVSVVLPDSIRYVEPKAIEGTSYYNQFMQQSSDDFLISNHCLLAYKGTEKTVRIPSGVRVIGAEAFKNHTEITSLKLPDSVEVICEGAFEGCTRLSKMVWEVGVEEIQDRSFYGTALKTVTIPETVKSIGLQAFSNKTITKYQGQIPAESHAVTAERLSNGAYRGTLTDSNGDEKIVVKGLEQALAVMDDLDTTYYLEIDTLKDLTGFVRAYERLGLELQKHFITGYSLYFTDNSEIPITYLGKKLLTVIIPISEEIGKQQLSVVTLDRNGQLEAVPCDRIRMEGNPYIRFTTDYISDYAIIGSDEAYKGEEMLLEGTVNLRQMSAAPGQDPYEMLKNESEISERITATELPTMADVPIGTIILAVLVILAIMLTTRMLVRKK